MRVEKKFFKGRIRLSGEHTSPQDSAPTGGNQNVRGVTFNWWGLLLTLWVAGRKRRDRGIHRRTSCPIAGAEAEFLDGSTPELCGEGGDFHFQK